MIRRRPERVAAALLAVVLCVLAGRGRETVTFDEHRVRGAIPFSLLATGHVRAAFDNAFSMTHGRPGVVLAYLPASLASFALGGRRSVGDPELAYPIDPLDMACAGVVAALWIGAAVLACGALGERLGGRARGGLAAWTLALLVLALHYGSVLFPTGPALALAALFAVAYHDLLAGSGSRVAAGLLLAATFAVYPGAYAVGAVLGADLLVARSAARERVTTVALVFLLALLGVEVFYRATYGGSYLWDLRHLSTTINLGDTRDGWRYPLDRLFATDGPAGVLVLLLALGSARRATGPARTIALGFLALYAFEAFVASTLLGEHVLYARMVAVWLALAVPLFAATLPVEGRGAAALVVALGLVQAPRLHAFATSRVDEAFESPVR